MVKLMEWKSRAPRLTELERFQCMRAYIRSLNAAGDDDRAHLEYTDVWGRLSHAERNELREELRKLASECANGNRDSQAIWQELARR